MNYKYSKINPTENKELYMYSGYYGIKFIQAYKHSRNEVIIKCLEKLKKIENKKEITDKILKFSKNTKHEKEETMQFFLNLLKNKFYLFQKNSIKSELTETISDLDYLFNKAVNNKILEKPRIDNLVKKIEIKKSFSTEVKQSFLHTSLHNDIDETYHLVFSFIIIKHFISSNLFKYLSVLLKLNDLLIYRFYNGKCINTDLLSCSIVLELNFFYELEEDMLGN